MSFSHSPKIFRLLAILCVLSTNIHAQINLALNSVTNVSCTGMSDGSLSVIASGGSGSYNYTIDGGLSWQASNSFENLLAGDYWLGVKDLSTNDEFLDQLFITIAESVELHITTTIADVSCPEGTDGSITADIMGGSGNFSYSWSSINGSGLVEGQLNQANLTAGNYHLTVSDIESGCFKQASAVINAPLTLNMSIDVVQPFCNGSNGEINIIHAQGGMGTPLFSIDAANWSTQPNYSGLISGNYTVIMRDENNCMISEQVTLNEPEVAIASGPSEICANSTELTANSPAYGVGTWSVIEGSGVFDDAMKPNTIVNSVGKGKNIYRWTVIGEDCSTHADVEVINNLVDVDAGDDVIQCNDTYTLNATTPESGISGQWTVNKGSCSFDNATNPDAVVNNLEKGDNILTWTLTKNGCTSSGAVTITNNLPTQAYTGSNQMVCNSETTLTGNMPDNERGETGTWSLISGAGLFEDINDPSTKINDMAKGENTYRWTISHQECTSFADLTVTNLLVDVNAGNDITVCEKMVTLNAQEASEGDLGEWSLVNGVGGGVFKPNEINNPNIEVGELDYGNNGFRWSINHKGCVSSDMVIVTNKAPYYIDPNGDKRECNAGAPILVNAPSAVMNADNPAVGIGQWSILSGGGSIVDVHNAGTQITNLPKGESVFRWTVYNHICSYHSDVTVTNRSIEQANAGRDQALCENYTTLVASEPTSAVGQWSVTQGSATFEDRNDYNTQVTNLSEGSNVLRWTLSNGYTTSYDEVIIINNQPTIANAGADIIVQNTHVSLSANNPVHGIGQWSLINGNGIFNDAFNSTTAVTNLFAGDNIFRWTIINEGCSSSDDMIVTYDISSTTPTLVKNKISTYPNPTNHFINVNTETESTIHYQLISNTGQVVKTGKINNDKRIDLSNLPCGVYLLTLKNQDINYSSKIIKIK